MLVDLVLLNLWVEGYCLLYFFFFSSRRRHTRFDCDWSSDVCSSDLGHGCAGPGGNVVDEHGQPGGVGDRGEVSLERGLGRLVVIGSHYEQAVNPGPDRKSVV